MEEDGEASSSSGTIIQVILGITQLWGWGGMIRVSKSKKGISYLKECWSLLGLEILKASHRYLCTNAKTAKYLLIICIAVLHSVVTGEYFSEESSIQDNPNS